MQKRFFYYARKAFKAIRTLCSFPIHSHELLFRYASSDFSTG